MGDMTQETQAMTIERLEAQNAVMREVLDECLGEMRCNCSTEGCDGSCTHARIKSALLLGRKKSSKKACELTFRVEYDPRITDGESLATAFDRLLGMVLSDPRIMSEYGNPAVYEVKVRWDGQNVEDSDAKE